MSVNLKVLSTYLIDRKVSEIVTSSINPLIRWDIPPWPVGLIPHSGMVYAIILHHKYLPSNNNLKPVFQKSTFQTELPNFMHYVTQCLEHVDRQALLVLKTNDLIRSIEYALKTQEHMVGFLVMTKCCNESIYRLEHKVRELVLL